MPQPWIVEQLIELLVKDTSIKQSGEDDNSGDLLKSLKNELMDLLEGEYF